MLPPLCPREALELCLSPGREKAGQVRGTQGEDKRGPNELTRTSPRLPAFTVTRPAVSSGHASRTAVLAPPASPSSPEALSALRAPGRVQ